MAAERIRGRLFTPSVCFADTSLGEGGKEIRRTPIMRKRTLPKKGSALLMCFLSAIYFKFQMRFA